MERRETSLSNEKIKSCHENFFAKKSLKHTMEGEEVKEIVLLLVFY